MRQNDYTKALSKCVQRYGELYRAGAEEELSECEYILRHVFDRSDSDIMHIKESLGEHPCDKICHSCPLACSDRLHISCSFGSGAYDQYTCEWNRKKFLMERSAGENARRADNGAFIPQEIIDRAVSAIAKGQHT